MEPAAPAQPTTNVHPGMAVGDADIDALLLAAETAIPDRPDEIVANAEAALARSEAMGNLAGQAYARALLGIGLYMRSDHERALHTLTQALTEIEPLGDLTGRALVLSGIAGVYVSLGQFENAMETALDALQQVRVLGDTEREGWLLAGLGNSYLDLGDLERAMEAGETALRLFGDLESETGQARAHSIVGGALRRLGRLDEAVAHHDSALRLAREAGVILNESRALHDLGEVAYDRGAAEQALAFHREALALRRETGNRQAQSTSLLHMGRALVALGRADEAIEVLREALALASEAGALPRESEVHEALSLAYEADGDPARALIHARRYFELYASLMSAQARARIQTVQARAEVEQARQEAEIAHLRSGELAATLDSLRAAQAQLIQNEKQASLGRLATGVAHELQNPLNFVANFADLNVSLAQDLLDAFQAGDAPDPDALAEDLEAIVQNAGRVRDHARRAEGIVRGLMGHVRDLGGERRPADLHELIERAVSTVLRGAEVRVERTYVDGLAPLDVAPASLQRVFVNLMDNARWAIERCAETEGDAYRPAIAVETEDLGDAVRVTLRDNGIGIPAAQCHRVFEPFFTTKPTGTGTGLGLSLAYSIVTEGHGGTLAVHSREGEGASFVLTLPR